MFYTVALTGAIEVAHLPALLANGVAIAAGATFNFLGTEEFAFAEEDVREGTSTGAVVGGDD